MSSGFELLKQQVLDANNLVNQKSYGAALKILNTVIETIRHLSQKVKLPQKLIQLLTQAKDLRNICQEKEQELQIKSIYAIHAAIQERRHPIFNSLGVLEKRHAVTMKQNLVTNLNFALTKLSVALNRIEHQCMPWQAQKKNAGEQLLTDLRGKILLYQSAVTKFIADNNYETLKAAHTTFITGCQTSLETARNELATLTPWQSFQQGIIDAINTCLKAIQQHLGYTIALIEPIKPVPLQTLETLEAHEAFKESVFSTNLNP